MRSGRDRLPPDESFSHAGNAAAAALAGVSAYLLGPTVVFYLLAFMSSGARLSIICIPVTQSITNSPVGCPATRQARQPIRLRNPCSLTALRSFSPVGRCWLFLAALIIMPARAALYTLSDHAAWLVGVQLLDGIGAGIFGAIFPVIVADLMRNTGRFNVAQGAVVTAQSIGAALSTSLAGIIVVKAGYDAAFLTLGAVAALGVVICALMLPRTRAADPTDANAHAAAEIGTADRAA